MSHVLERLGILREVTIPKAVELWVLIGFGGCGCWICNESIVDRNGILGVVVETTAFGFGGGGKNAGAPFCVDWTIWFGVGICWQCWWIVTEKIVARNDTMSFWED
jgi:hypothetical protein